MQDPFAGNSGGNVRRTSAAPARPGGRLHPTRPAPCRTGGREKGNIRHAAPVRPSAKQPYRVPAGLPPSFRKIYSPQNPLSRDVVNQFVQPFRVFPTHTAERPNAAPHGPHIRLSRDQYTSSSALSSSSIFWPRNSRFTMTCVTFLRLTTMTSWFLNGPLLILTVSPTRRPGLTTS